MWYVAYGVIGLLLASIVVLDDGERAITKPLYVVLITAFWPIVVVYFVWAMSQVGVITYKGKVVWQAKEK